MIHSPDSCRRRRRPTWPQLGSWATSRLAANFSDVPSSPFQLRKGPAPLGEHQDDRDPLWHAWGMSNASGGERTREKGERGGERETTASAEHEQIRSKLPWTAAAHDPYPPHLCTIQASCINNRRHTRICRPPVDHRGPTTACLPRHSCYGASHKHSTPFFAFNPRHDRDSYLYFQPWTPTLVPIQAVGARNCFPGVLISVASSMALLLYNHAT